MSSRQEFGAHFQMQQKAMDVRSTRNEWADFDLTSYTNAERKALEKYIHDKGWTIAARCQDAPDKIVVKF
jgi:hypothetical protein